MINIEPPSTPSVLELLPTISKSALSRFLNRARALIPLSGQVEVLLTSDAELQRLNRIFRRKNKPTDILSFPTLPELSSAHAGDLAISLDTAAAQAAAQGHSLPTELRVLLLHGLLHLAGHDHETDSGEMAAREQALRRELRLPFSLTERAQQPDQPARATRA